MGYPYECPCCGFAWNPAINACDWETNFEPCEFSSPPTTTPTPTTTPANLCEGLHGVLVFDDENCIAYQCSHGQFKTTKN